MWMGKSNKQKTLIIILLILLSLGIWVFDNNNDKDEGMGFTERILNAENKMVSVPQEVPMTTELLEKFKPRVFVDRESYFPVDFYEDYLPNTHLKLVGKIDKLISTSVSTMRLNELKNESDYYLDYQLLEEELIDPNIDSYNTSIYGRMYRSVLKSDGDTVDLIFLKYTLVYPYSGLPSGTTNWKLVASNIIGDSMAWHELDIHGAVHVVIDEDTMLPVGLILAQHNHHRVYMVGEDFDWPEDERVSISVAKFSNEPYLADLTGVSRLERTVGNPMAMDFLLGMEDKEPLTSGYDYIPSITEEAIEINTILKQLSLDDPLYTATMGLGDRKKIFGIFRTFYMDGPPGADFYTMPELLDLAELLAFWDIDVNDEKYMQIYENSELSFMNFDADELLKYQRSKMVNKIRQILENHYKYN